MSYQPTYYAADYSAQYQNGANTAPPPGPPGPAGNPYHDNKQSATPPSYASPFPAGVARQPSPYQSLASSSLNGNAVGYTPAGGLGAGAGSGGYAVARTPPAPNAMHPDKVGKFAGGRSVYDLLNPAPACFSRRPPRDISYAPFQNITIPALDGPDLAKGFPAVLPPSQAWPHPFSAHDVTEEDWMWFLASVKAGASLGVEDRVMSNLVMPAVLGVAFLPSIFLTRGIDKKRKNKKVTPVMELVDQWNNYFFAPRGLIVVLTQSESYSGETWYLQIIYQPSGQGY